MLFQVLEHREHRNSGRGPATRAAFPRNTANKSSTYCSKHDSENQPPEAPQNDPGRGGPPGQSRQSPERAEEDPQESCFQKLGLPSCRDDSESTGRVSTTTRGLPPWPLTWDASSGPRPSWPPARASGSGHGRTSAAPQLALRGRGPGLSTRSPRAWEAFPAHCVLPRGAHQAPRPHARV